MTRSAPDASQWDEARRRNRDQGLAKRLFTVVGPHEIAGKHKGETVELEITTDQADALILAGHVVEQGHRDEELVELKDSTETISDSETPAEYTKLPPKTKQGKPLVPYTDKQ